MSHLILLATGHVHLQCTLEEEYRSECTERFHWLWIVKYPCLHCCRSIQNVLPSSIGHKGSLSSLIIMGVISQQTFWHRFTVGSRSILDFNIGWIKSPKMQLVLTSLASSYPLNIFMFYFQKAVHRDVRHRANVAGCKQGSMQAQGKC